MRSAHFLSYGSYHFCILLIHRFFYNAAVDAHENYGGYIKALFDLYHGDSLKKLKSFDIR